MATLMPQSEESFINTSQARFAMRGLPLSGCGAGIEVSEANVKSTGLSDELLRFAALGRLSAEIAHEINSPLNAILLTAEAALLFPNARDAVHAFTFIRDEVIRVTGITKGALALARGNTVKVPGDVNAVVKTAVDLANRYIRADRLACTLELDADLPLVALNVIGMEQVIVNLLKNAAESGAGPVRVVVRTRKSTGGVLVSIADDGPGISTDRIDDLFAPFVSTKRDSGGTGLGLSISRRIIADHGGQISVKSAIGLGSIFSIRLNGIKSRPARVMA